MKNIQVIDGALNCTYDVFSIDEDSFFLIFPNDQDVEFAEEFYDRVGPGIAQDIFDRLWDKRLDKKYLVGIHGTLFFGLMGEKKQFYPTKKESEMMVVIPG